jgi:hypothetical protein
MQLHRPIRSVFEQLQAVLDQLSDAEYTSTLPVLSGNSIGKHVRHIIDMYQCLLEGYDSGNIDYAQRRRDVQIENSRAAAIDQFDYIYSAIELADKPLIISADYHEASGDLIPISSNFHRELAFNLEHTIHHMALIRIGVAQFSRISLPASFGVAFATVNFRNQCAQ